MINQQFSHPKEIMINPYVFAFALMVILSEVTLQMTGLVR